MVVRHELAPVKEPEKKPAGNKPKDKEHEDKAAADKAQHDQFKDAAALYSLYMHLAPPRWEALDGDFYATKVPWFQMLLRCRHGGVVDMDPESAQVGTTLWSTKKLEQDAATFTVRERPAAMTARRDGKRIALGKPSPEDVEQALKALEEGCIVTFHEPALQVKRGEVIGRVDAGGFLHWELFSPAGDEHGISKLAKAAQQHLSVQLKLLSETRKDNFLEIEELQALADKLSQVDKAEIHAALQKTKAEGPRQVDEQEQYRAALRQLYESEKTFARQDRDDARTKEPGLYTYPVTVGIDIPEACRKDAVLSAQPRHIEVKFTRKDGAGEKPCGKQGALELPSLKDKRVELVVQVPAEADYLHLTGDGLYLERIQLGGFTSADDKQRATTSAFCASMLGYRFRDGVLDHLNEWQPEGLERLIDKLCETPARRAHLGDPLKKIAEGKPLPEQIKALKRHLRCLTWWGRKKSKDDPFGEVAVLGAKGKEVSLFGAAKDQLPADAMLDNIHPVTGLWLLDLLEHGKKRG